MKKKHKHLFVHTGGGCRIGKGELDFTDKQCDDEYKCRCGRKEKIWTNQEKHFSLPRKMGLKKLSEIKIKE